MGTQVWVVGEVADLHLDQTGRAVWTLRPETDWIHVGEASWVGSSNTWRSGVHSEAETKMLPEVLIVHVPIMKASGFSAASAGLLDFFRSWQEKTDGTHYKDNPECSRCPVSCTQNILELSGLLEASLMGPFPWRPCFPHH